MTSSIHDLLRTEYYHPALNSAVFDGPLRIYFAQSQEAMALDLYFKLQKVFEEAGIPVGTPNPQRFFVVLLYPQAELFQAVSGTDNSLRVLSFGSDVVVLTHGQMDDLHWVQTIRELSFLVEQSDALYVQEPLIAIS